MGFIDGHHAYETVIHDFYAFLQTASENFSLLFDDYNYHVDVNVSKVIKEEIVPNFDVTQIMTLDRLTSHKDMCWIESRSLKKPLREIFPKSKSAQIINDYLKWEKRWKLRKNLNSKIPLFGRFRFRH